MLSLPPYSQWLLDVACERTTRAQPTHPSVNDASNFVAAILRILALAIQEGEPITRLGMDTAMDAVFGLPELTPLLDDDAPVYQHRFATVDLPHCVPRFHPFWHHIVLPAWQQHADIHRTLAIQRQGPIEPV